MRWRSGVDSWDGRPPKTLISGRMAHTLLFTRLQRAGGSAAGPFDLVRKDDARRRA